MVRIIVIIVMLLSASLYCSSGLSIPDYELDYHINNPRITSIQFRISSAAPDYVKCYYGIADKYRNKTFNNKNSAAVKLGFEDDSIKQVKINFHFPKNSEFSISNFKFGINDEIVDYNSFYL